MLFYVVLKEIEPEYVLTEEEIHGIFDVTDSANVKFSLKENCSMKILARKIEPFRSLSRFRHDIGQ